MTKENTGSHALIIVDVQNDFVDGSLATERGAEVAEAITKHIELLHRYDVIIGTKDWHINPKGHFAPEGEEPDYVDTWPVHCVAETKGAESHPALETSQIQAWFHKGEYDPAYSGFEGHLAGDDEAGKIGLEDWLRARNVSAVTVVGIATDFCVRETALDAHNAGFDTTVIKRLSAPVSVGGEKTTFEELSNAGVHVK